MMAEIVGLFNKPINVRVVTGCVLSLALVATPAVVARAEYKPPEDQKTPDKETRTNSGTTRGCDGGDIPLTVLASQNYVGRTTSTHPTFAWFVPDSKSLKLKFTIYSRGSDGNFTEVHSMSLQSSPGIMTLSPFPEGEPGLLVGKDYFWQVVILCDPSYPSSAVVDRVQIEVVEMPPDLQDKLDNAVDSAEKADLYAEAGFWYNALDEALKLAEESKLGEVASALLEDLAKWEKPKPSQELTEEERESIEKRMGYLIDIANVAR
ncbi:MAG: DUF928 domain-containing protein [Moorea sp. SIO1F2]|uniref:DUF928 domain-containing protein n=1 Tax=Moorena sp. SIO1F2 TaxID=2607819 RepID=UPI0013BBBB50|nr:DUF928 domain-containing protein [Moorena sp. SIO1F2]NET82529.1 DUF928 domain-containing protein [Moorena sp. SIO1F2]